jgi:pimeloyl-ACP methyl ester carboxylesterase
MFYYQSEPRLSLGLESPNDCATIVAMLSVVTIGLTSKCIVDAWWRKYSLLFLSVIIASFTVILIFTYSRGGWVAYSAGLIFLILTAPKYRKPWLPYVLLFLIGIAFVPKGFDRAGSIADKEDRSITNRIEVWKGATAMTAAHPFTGVGMDEFGSQFSAWYQPLSMNTRYGAALNNYLTLSSECGSFSLIIYLLLIFTPLWMATQIAYQEQRGLILGICAGLLVYSVSAFFTCSLRMGYINLLSGFFWLALIVFVGRKWYSEGYSFKWTRALFPMAVCLFITAIILGIGSVLLSLLPTKVKFFTFNDTQQMERAVIVVPQHRAIKGVVLYFHGEGQSLVSTAKDTLRPLAEEGFTVVSIDYRLRGREGLADACALLRWASIQTDWSHMPLYLCGFDLGGRIAILTACREPNSRLKAVAVISVNTEWPFPDLSPTFQLDHLNVPSLLIQGAGDPVVAVAESQRFLDQSKQRGKNVTLIVLPGGHNLDDLWPESLKQLTDFLYAHP